MIEPILITSKLNSDIQTLPNYEAYFAEGDTGELRLYLMGPMYQGDIDTLEQSIRSQGVVLTAPIRQDARVLMIQFKKAIAPLVILAAAVAAIAAVGSGIVGWQIFKTVQAGVPLWVWLVGGAALAYLLFREPAKQAGGLAIHAGKMYITKKMLNPGRRYEA